MKRSKRVKIKWDRVLLIIVFPIIIIGGVIMGYNLLFDENTSRDNDENIENGTNNWNDEKLNNDTTDDKENDEDNEKDNDNEDLDFELESAPVNSSEYKNSNDGEYLTSKGYKLKIENGIAYIDGFMIVNKTYSLPRSYQPLNPYQAIDNQGRCNSCIDKEVMQAFKLMQSDANSIGLNLYISSGYRSYSYQEGLYNSYSAVDGIEGADTYSARPGHSEHQTGLCFDLNEISDVFANTDEGKWVNDNAHLYGFIIRYPKGKSNITGYKYESWHLRYVGKSLAEKLYNNGNWITMEEYYGLTSTY